MDAGGGAPLDWTPAGHAAILAAANNPMIDGAIEFPVLASNVKFDAVSADDDGLEQLRTSGVFTRKSRRPWLDSRPRPSIAS